MAGFWWSWSELELPVTDDDREWARRCASIAVKMRETGKIRDWRQSRFYSSYEIDFAGRIGEAALRRRAGLDLFDPEIIWTRRNDDGHDLDGLDVEVKTIPWRSAVHFHQSANGRRHHVALPVSRPWGIRTTAVCSYFFKSGRVFLDGFATVQMIREDGIPVGNGGTRRAVAIAYADLLPPGVFLDRLDRILGARPALLTPPPPDRLAVDPATLGPPTSAAEAAWRADYPHLAEWRRYPRW